MARILIAWELGEAFGHLARCQRLAMALAQRGHEVVVALKDVRHLAGYFLSSKVTVLAAPVPSAPDAKTIGPLSTYSDLLSACGFGRSTDLRSRLLTWRGILTLAKPDLVIGDHAPTALLAAKLFDVPCLAVGNGFSIPPPVSPWPSIAPWRAVPVEAAIESENRVNAVIADVVGTLGGRNAVEVRDLFGKDDIIDSFPELDHYGNRGLANYVGPIVSIPAALDVDWQRSACKKVVAYLRPSVPGFRQIVRGLAELDAETICVVPGLDVSVAKRLATTRMRVARVPLNLTRVLRSADLAVGYGTGGFSTQALLAGVPIAMSPKYAEQAILARRIEDIGAGRLITTSDVLSSVSEQLVQALTSDEMHANAAAFRERHRDFSTELAIERSIEIVERAVSGSWNSLSFPQENQTNKGHSSCLH